MKLISFKKLMVGVFLIWVLWGVLLLLFFCSWNNRGLSGDMFGSLNALFTGLAFAGLCYTISLQRKTLDESEKRNNEEKEIREKRDFENTFFQLLNSFESLVNSMDVLYDSKNPKEEISVKREARGRDCFRHFYNVIQRKTEDATELASILDEYGRLYEKRQSDLGCYFRVLYNIFKYIANYCPDDKLFYAHLVRAYLSNQQVALLFYNGLTREGSKFKKYIEEFSLLKHLPDGFSIKDEILNEYSSSAYDEEQIN